MNGGLYRKDRKSQSQVAYRACLTLGFSRAGGVMIVGGDGKIDINNTFEERLRLLETDALPVIRTTLFGKNVNRKFYD